MIGHVDVVDFVVASVFLLIQSDLSQILINLGENFQVRAVMFFS